MAINNDVIGYLLENPNKCEKDFRNSNLFVDIHNKPKAPRKILHMLVEEGFVSREKIKGVWYYNLVKKEFNEEVELISDEKTQTLQRIRPIQTSNFVEFSPDDDEIKEALDEIEKETEKIENTPTVDEIRFPALSLQKEKKKRWWKR